MELNKYFDDQYMVTFKGVLLFEVKSFIGRHLFSRQPKISKSSNNYLHLGCGDLYVDGFVNADFFSILWIMRKHMRKPDWMLDLRYPLNCPDNIWDGVFTEHTIEHLYHSQVYNLLEELHRTMKDGAVIRITVPDLKKYVDFYTKNFSNDDYLDFQKHYKLGAEAIRELTQNYFHHSVWDAELLTEIMKCVGFHDVQERKFKDGENTYLLIEKEERKWGTLYMEGVK